MSVSTASTSRPTVFGLFTRPATPELDLEAQLPQPTPAHTHSARTSASVDETTSDPIDDFFGASRPSSSRRTLSLTGTRDSRHDDAHAATPIEVEAVAPPPYECSIEPPAYTTVSDQPTLAMYLFKYGFLFPLFWVAGAFILLSPLQAPSDWETTKPEYERQEIIESMRRAEVKWAKRCLIALLVSTLIGAAIALTAVLVMRT
ncbi:uncharacterized protein TRAVEDRAFT_65922 [Trametes versicolor FP-101664 SS1]|uniref:uncharacterized protein n=1 Tax=Trametes versicolor (strain FP-101664) TaxID=717944 RepID=UPI000462289B|nr:uncharacterized protein TRAVEDRAFT_65922 [Trametes versicolor FP-101664 SS1]EIW55486.1 hypothetical protein TRAVEDRAFT_65922 [Trametes versicolor FP-101664 SS1]